MLSRLLGLDEAGKISNLELQLRLDWPKVVLLIAAVAAVAYAVWLYRRERSLRRRRRVLLGLLRAGVLVCVLVLLFEPVLAFQRQVRLPRTVLVLTDFSDSMNMGEQRRHPRELREAALALGKLPYDTPEAPMSEALVRDMADATRIELAKGLLQHPTRNVFREIGESYRVRHFAFGDRLTPAKGEGERAFDAFAGRPADEKSTRLGSALEEAVIRFSGQSIAGIVVLTDGAANEGLAPLAVARRMKERAIPLYPVGLGLPNPADIRVDSVIVPETVFVKDKVPVRLQISSTGFAGQRAQVTLTFRGEEITTKSVLLNDRARFLELLFEPLRPAEAARVEVSVRPEKITSKEASEANNRIAKTIRVIDEKIKVLYIEGKPRWEYRYLRRVLLRDHRLDVHFWMTEGDDELARYSQRNLKSFPVTAEKAFGYHLVILGDVDWKKSRLGQAQLSRIEQLVAEQGGSLLMLCGPYHAPAEYVGTPIEDMLPVKIRPDGWENVDDMTHPQATAEGLHSAVAALEYPEDRNQALWSRVRPLFTVPRLDGRKKAAIVLVTLSDAPRRREPYPLICWQRYRAGKVMFVGTDQLWRLRFKRGDKYHARFWSQAIQFLTLSRLLGGNKRIRLETDRNQYRLGERVRISANVLDESYSPSLAKTFDVVLERLGPQGRRTTISLAAVPGMQGLFLGFFAPEEAGRYELRTVDGDARTSNRVRFDVEAVSLERQEPAMQEALLRRMAEESGGKYFSIVDLPELTKELPDKRPTTTLRETRDLFDLPAIFVALLILLGVEWLVRRRSDLV